MTCEIDFISYLKQIGYVADANIGTVNEIHRSVVLPWLLENSREYGMDAVENGLRVCLYSYEVLGSKLRGYSGFDGYFFSISDYIRRNYFWNHNKQEATKSVPKGNKRIGVIAISDTIYYKYAIEVINTLSQSFSHECHLFEIQINGDGVGRGINSSIDNRVTHHRFTIRTISNNLLNDLDSLYHGIRGICMDSIIGFMPPIWNYLICEMSIADRRIIFDDMPCMKLTLITNNTIASFGSPILFKQKICSDYWNVIPFYDFNRSKRIRYPIVSRRIIIYTNSDDCNEEVRLEINDFSRINNSFEFWLIQDNRNTQMIEIIHGGKVRINTRRITLDRMVRYADAVIDYGISINRRIDILALSNRKPLFIREDGNSIWDRDVKPVCDIVNKAFRRIYVNDSNINYKSELRNVFQAIELFSENKNLFLSESIKEILETCASVLSDRHFYIRYVNKQACLYNALYKNKSAFVNSLERLIDVPDDTRVHTNHLSVPNLQSPEPNGIIAITAMSRCVNRCAFCLQSNARFDPVIRVQDEKYYLKMLDELTQRTKNISVTTFTETLEYKIEILKRVRIAKEKGLVAAFETSNVFWDEDFYIELFTQGIGRILMSINAPTRELYERVTQRDYYDRVIDNADKLILLRDRINPEVKLHMHIMLFKEFIDDAQTLINRYSGKVDYIYYQGLCNWGSDIWNKDEYQRIRLTPLKMKKERIPCPSIFDTLVLHPDGNYYVCGMSYQHHIAEKPVALLGNASNITIGDAWRRLSYYRKKHLSGEWSDLECCKECNGWLNWTLYLDDIVVNDDDYIEGIVNER